MDLVCFSMSSSNEDEDDGKPRAFYLLSIVAAAVCGPFNLHLKVVDFHGLSVHFLGYKISVSNLTSC